MNDYEKREQDEKLRMRQAHLRFGTDKPKCIYCDESDWRCLELHHVAGQAFDGFTAIACRNCHRKLSDMQRDHPRMIDTGDEPNFLEVVGRFLLGLADLFFQLVRVMREFGNKMIALAQRENAEVQL